MEPIVVLGFQWLMSLVVYGCVAGWFVAPWLDRLPASTALMIVTAPHLIRHVSAMSLAPGVAVAQTMPEAWAWSVSVGDAITVALALAALAALRARARNAGTLCWLAHVVGALDIIHVGILARRYQIVEHLGAQWFVVSMAVPMLVVAHVLAFWILIQRGVELRAEWAMNIAQRVARMRRHRS
jgi:hypothetical protein